MTDPLRPSNLKYWVAWKELSPLGKWLPIGWVVFYLGILKLAGVLNLDHVMVCLVILIPSYGNRVIRRFRDFILPLYCTGVVYDSQRYWGDYLRGRIRVDEPYNFDKRFFGISTPQGVLTPNEWCQLHIHPALDLYTGFFYITFIGIFLLFCAAFVFWKSRTGTPGWSPKELEPRSKFMMWAFFVLNCLGYSTYYWYPAAPPWYVTLYGLGPANMAARPNPAGAIRFDEILGTHFFTGFYGRSADVFGAIPSLHVAYPFLAVLYAHQFKWGRTFAWFFYLSMCFSAVYLNHHYILDILWGSGYAVIVWWGFEQIYRRYFSKPNQV